MESYKLPTKIQHQQRNQFNEIPQGEIIFKGEIDGYKQKIYVDTKGRKWHEMKWWNAFLHNPAFNSKFIYYNPTGDESSEIIVPKKHIDKRSKKYHVISPDKIFIGSYNYKDFRLTSRREHFIADILPPIIYCSCIGH